MYPRILYIPVYEHEPSGTLRAVPSPGIEATSTAEALIECQRPHVTEVLEKDHIFLNEYTTVIDEGKHKYTECEPEERGWVWKVEPIMVDGRRMTYAFLEKKQ